MQSEPTKPDRNSWNGRKNGHLQGIENGEYCLQRDGDGIVVSVGGSYGTSEVLERETADQTSDIVPWVPLSDSG